MLRVAINTRFLLSNLEGIGTFTHEICQRLVQNNPDVEFHFLFDRKYQKKYIYGENVVPHVLFPPARHPWLWQLWYEWSVPRILKKIKADVFFSPDNYCSLKTNVPTLMVTHDLAYLHYPDHLKKIHLDYFKRNTKRHNQKAKIVACVSQFTQNDVIKQYQIDGAKTMVMHNGCSKNFRTVSNEEKKKIKAEVTGGKDYLLFIGAIHPRKNVARLIQAFEIFKSKTRSDIKLVLIGRMAWNTDEIESSINNSSFKKDIILLGHVADVADILSAATALCYPSLFEGFGIPILEAFNAVVPVLTSNVSAMPEVAGNAAVLVNPFDVNNMAQGIESIVNDTMLRDNLITLGKERAKAFSWDKSAAKVMGTLRKCAE